jgi:hypothetical protein
LLDLLPCIEAVQERHPDVYDDNLRLERGSNAHECSPVTYRGHHIEFRFEQLLARISYENVIVSNDDSRSVVWHL